MWKKKYKVTSSKQNIQKRKKKECQSYPSQVYYYYFIITGGFFADCIRTIRCVYVHAVVSHEI